MKIKRHLAAVTIVAMVGAAFTLLLAPAASAAATLTVCASGCDFTTIQDAVTAASAGDTINVGPGIYPTTGNTGITLDKPLTLNGAQWGVDARTRGPGGVVDAETVMPTTSGPYVFNLAADDITIDGFMFPDMGQRGFDSYSNVDHLTVRNNIFKSTTGNSQGGNIQFGGGGTLHANYFDFEGNYVQNGGDGNMIYMGHAMDNGTIRNNFINGDNFAFGPFGVRTGWLIEGNEFDGNVPGHGAYYGYGINANLGDAIIRNNYVHQMVVGLGQISLVGGSVTGNTFNDNQYAAFQLWGGEYGSIISSNVQVANNLIKYNGLACTGFGDASHGIRLRPGLDATTIHLHYNNFVDLGVGSCAGQAWAIRQNGTGSADATLNYWGTPVTAASIAAKIGQGTAVVAPWISAYTDDPAHAGQLGFWPLISPSADLSVTKSDSPDPVHIGQKLTYTIPVMNNGPDTATGVTLTDTMPKTTGFGSVSTTQGTCTRSKLVVTCKLGSLASGGTATVTIVVRPNTKGTITNRVNVLATSPNDPDTTNNTATASTTVLP